MSRKQNNKSTALTKKFARLTIASRHIFYNRSFKLFNQNKDTISHIITDTFFKVD